jgi:tetratricopeptide (TPR) repeat protein
MRGSKRKSLQSAPVSSVIQISPSNRKIFRWLAALGLPLLILAGAELVLRTVGWGYPTHFFLSAKAGAHGIYRENPQFGWRFFPRRLARAPDPVIISRVKSPGAFRIFVFGESAALGDPEPAYGFSRMLREILEERCPGVKFEVFNVSMTAINSHVILPIARDCVPFQADLWVIYMGNNEVVGPFGAASVFGLKTPPLWFIRASLAARRTCLVQMLAGWWERMSPGRHSAQEWEGMRMMVKEQVRASDPALQLVYAHFRRNLEDTLAVAAGAGTKAIVCSMSSNLRDCPPFASLNITDLSTITKAEWERLLATGAQLEDHQNSTEALSVFRQANEIDPGHAALAFRMARCEMAAGKTDRAREHYTLARDLDALRFRADTQINRIIREVCAQRIQQGVSLADVEAWVANSVQSGVPGRECFWDHVHFNFTGNYRVAQGLADCVLARLPEIVRQTTAQGRVLAEAECAERLAFTEWDQRAVLEIMLRRFSDAPFTGQLDHDQLIQRWSGSLTELDAKLDREGLSRAVDLYAKALARRNDDWLLHHRLAFLLEGAGDYSGAELHWRKVVEMLPDYVDALFKLGDVIALQSRPAEAERIQRQVLRLRPNSFEAMNGLGLALLDQGKLEEATRWFQQALRLQPKLARLTSTSD